MRGRRRVSRISIEPKVSKGWLIFDWFVIVIVIVLFGIGAIAMVIKPQKSQSAGFDKIPEAGKSIVLQVVNGSGKGHAEISITDAIRRIGIDVRDVGKSEFVYPLTLLLCRSGNMATAESLASLLGLSRDRLLLQKSDIHVDATLILGTDFKETLPKLQIE